MLVCVKDCSGNPFVFFFLEKTKDWNERPDPYVLVIFDENIGVTSK